MKGNNRKHCKVHKKACYLQPLNGFAAGFSCTSYSRLNKDSKKNSSAMQRAAEGDPTVSRFTIIEHLIMNHQRITRLDMTRLTYNFDALNSHTEVQDSLQL